MSSPEAHCSYGDPAPPSGGRFRTGFIYLHPTIAAVFIQHIPLFQHIGERLRCISVSRQRRHLQLNPVIQRQHQRDCSPFPDRQHLMRVVSVRLLRTIRLIRQSLLTSCSHLTPLISAVFVLSYPHVFNVSFNAFVLYMLRFKRPLLSLFTCTPLRLVLIAS